MSPRRLSEDERALWQGVARSVSPLRKKKRKAAAADAGEPAVSSAPPKARAKSPAMSRSGPKASPLPAYVPPPPKAPAIPPLAPLGKKARQRVARGSRAIEARLDLHGMTQAEAHGALLHFLRSRQTQGVRLVLVITGKGLRNADGLGERGVLKRMVPLWLGQPELRGLVIGFESASVAHGGDGALYVSLRRSREE